MISSEVLGASSAVLYLIPATVLFRAMKRGQNIHRKWLILLPSLLGVCVHAVLLFRNIVMPNALDLNIINALSLVAGLMCIILLLFAIRQPVENLGIVVLPIAALTVFSSSLYQPAEISIDLEVQSHVFFSITAYGLLGLAALQAMVVSVQAHHLHNHRPGGFIQSLPPLNTMESLLFSMLTAGFILLSLSLISGFIFLDDMFAQHLVHKTLLSIGAWFLFGTLLYGRWRYGWRGKRAVKWTMFAFGLLILAYFGSKFVLEFVMLETAVA